MSTPKTLQELFEQKLSDAAIVPALQVELATVRQENVRLKAQLNIKEFQCTELLSRTVTAKELSLQTGATIALVECWLSELEGWRSASRSTHFNEDIDRELQHEAAIRQLKVLCTLMEDKA